MGKGNLTKKQISLVHELENLTSKLGLKYSDIIFVERKLRTGVLEFTKDQFVRSQVILKYVFIDEILSDIICWYFFGKKKSFPQLWKTKHFQTFNYFIVEKLFLQQKLDLVKNIHTTIPSRISEEIQRLNDLRNALAHSFFPENRRRKPKWKGKDIFTLDGISNFVDDMQKVVDFFVNKYFKGSIANC